MTGRQITATSGLLFLVAAAAGAQITPSVATERWAAVGTADMALFPDGYDRCVHNPAGLLGLREASVSHISAPGTAREGSVRSLTRAVLPLGSCVAVAGAYFPVEHEWGRSAGGHLTVAAGVKRYLGLGIRSSYLARNGRSISADSMDVTIGAIATLPVPGRLDSLTFGLTSRERTLADWTRTDVAQELRASVAGLGISISLSETSLLSLALEQGLSRYYGEAVVPGGKFGVQLKKTRQ